MLTNNLNELSRKVFANNLAVGWWSEEEYAKCLMTEGNRYDKETATLLASKLALVHSEVSEALEGMRKGLMDDHLPHRRMFEVELSDALIRIFDIAGFAHLDLEGAVMEKFLYNQTRPDHQRTSREGDGGKTI